MEEQEPSGVVAMYKEREQQDPLGSRTIPKAIRTTRQVRGPAWFYDLRSVTFGDHCTMEADQQQVSP